MKTNAEIHAECVRFLGLAHEDYRELDIIYVLLAMKTFADARLGTYANAMDYYRKSLQATSRRVELYGPCTAPNTIIRSVRNSLKRAYQDPEGEGATWRKVHDMLPTEDGYFVHQDICLIKANRICCLNCKRREGLDGIQM
jgi:hypothetical protein